MRIKRVAWAFGILAAIAISACGGINDVDRREWDLATDSVEDGTDALRDYAAVLNEVEASLRNISELGGEIPSSEDLRVDGADFKRSNDVVVQGIKRRADALRDYAAAMREANVAMSGLDAAGGAPNGLWSGRGLAGASEDQMECYFGLVIRSRDYPGMINLAEFVLLTDPNDMEVFERRWMDKILNYWSGDLIEYCDDYIYGGP